MEKFKSYREESKSDFGTTIEETKNITIEQLNTGAILRIADATEKMASNYVRMENDLATYKRRAELKESEIRYLLKSNAALRGHIKWLKNRMAQN